ncbi:replication regulatory protein RepA (plasmid) [Escherichia coli]
MSQTENTVTSSSGAKRAYRKGNPLSDAEKQRLSVARKRASFKEVKVFLEPKYKGRCEQVPDMRSCLSSGAMEQGSS